MSAIQQLLTEHLDIWSAADTEKKTGRGRSSGNAASVYGIKKLRELILQLAVRGKLVPQDAKDEPASELLKRIKSEKAKLLAEGKNKKDKPLPPIADEEKPFESPQGWEWVRLGEIAEIIRGVTYGKSDASDNPLPDYVPLLRGNNINRVLNFDGPVYVPKSLLNEAQYVKAGDIVIAMSSGSADLVGKAAQAIDNFEGGFGAFCGVVRSVSSEVFSYFGFFFQTPLYKIRAAGHGKGIGINNLQKTALQTLEVPLPPLAEQHRIVAKVDELMALCDQLETQHINAAEAHEKLVSHLLATLIQLQNAADFSTNWQRIAAHFDILFTTEASIDALKQTLLQLAVMGKLVPQDPKDEPASELLKRIQAEKSKLIAEGKIKKDKPLPLITEEQKPFELPQGWKWVRLGDLVEKSGSGWSPSCEGHPRTGDEWGVLKVSAVSWGKFLPSENKALPKTLNPRLDCVVGTGDFLVTRANTEELVARSVVVEDCPPNLMLSDKIVRLRLTLHCDSRFINIANSSTFARGYYSLEAGGTSSSMKNVTREQILSLLVAAPPLSEQHRIVTRVDELMELCDQLKSRLTSANQLQQKLADVIIEQAIA
jgi:type I restriction enzyme S subunit